MAATPPPLSEHAIIPIIPDGDIVLRIEHASAAANFRISSAALQSHSRYFARLLQGGFGESERVTKGHTELTARYGDVAKAPAEQLPLIEIQDLGRISAVKSLEALCSDFLLILHCKELSAALPVSNLANLAIVADRFDALECVRGFVERKKLIRGIDGRTTAKADSGLTEERVRQRLLVAVMLGYAPWMDKYSTRLLNRGWVGRESAETEPLWWDLPNRVEEELAFRRDCILETIQSLPTYFIGLYTSRERQCRLGYDSSAQCDSFQLGEMLRYFTRIGALQVKGMLIDAEDASEPYAGDLVTLIDTLRQVPEYQIDKHHTHCGVRTRIVPLLDMLIEAVKHIGLCLECWAEDRRQYAWIEAKRPLLWKRSGFRLRLQGHRDLHEHVRSLFTAVERDWSS